MNHNEMSETYKAEFEKRDNGQRVGNPASNWQQVCTEVEALDNRNAGQGYMAYSSCRVFQGMTHEQASEYVSKNVMWR